MHEVEQLSSKTEDWVVPQLRVEIVAVLGRRDQPTDGVEDYCHFLGQALKQDGHEFSLVRVHWKEKGWLHAARQISHLARGWRKRTVLLQFTSLSWSRRGFPFGVLVIAQAIKRKGARLAVVYHEPDAVRHPGVLASVRTKWQEFVIRSLYRSAGHAIFTVPISNVKWLPSGDRKSLFIPIGANIPEVPVSVHLADRTERNSVGVFCLTEGQRGRREALDVAIAVREASKIVSGLQLRIFGRGSEEAGPTLQSALTGCDVKVSVSGVVPAEEVAQIISGLDALLFVRGSVSLRRGTALAAVACGVPLIAYGRDEANSPLKQAGIMMVPSDDATALGAALARVLRDEALWNSLRERSLQIHQELFSWPAIARRFAAVLAP